MKTRGMTRCALMAALMAVCAWISVPVGDGAVSMQTFAVFLALGVLGGRAGTGACVVYLCLGAVGMPVFTGFRGGAAALLDPTGGFLWGFLACGLTYWAAEKLGKLPAMVAGMMVCYVCGSWWFSVYANTDLLSAALVCVVPWLVGDGIKLALALSMSERLKKHIK